MAAIPLGDLVRELLEQVDREANLLIDERADGILVAARDVGRAAKKAAKDGKLPVSGPLEQQKLRRIADKLHRLVEDELGDEEDDDDPAPAPKAKTGAGDDAGD